MTEEELSFLKETIKSYCGREGLPSEEELTDLLDTTISTLEAEERTYRPLADDGNVGGLLDFQQDSLPLVIVPDLHARQDFLPSLLSYRFEGLPPLLSALNQNLVRVICVGDAVHTEIPELVYERWRQSYRNWMNGNIDCPSMRQEMKECFATIMTVMALKNAFPANFHFLKGNHENILNKNGGGDYSFRKYVQEGEMVRDFVRAVYSDMVLHLLSCYEGLLPIVAIFRNMGVSHAEPGRAHTREQIINYHADDDVILDFTWTANDAAEEGSVAQQFSLLGGSPEKERVLWCGGHRPIEGKYFLRQDGAYLQLHNPFEMNVAFINPQKDFDPQTDIISIR